MFMCLRHFYLYVEIQKSCNQHSYTVVIAIISTKNNNLNVKRNKYNYAYILEFELGKRLTRLLLGSCTS